MKRTLSIVAIALLVVAIPAVAGEKGDGHGCSYETQECLNAMVDHFKTRGWVGIELESDDTGSLTVLKVEPNSPAEAGGLRVGDVLLALNGIRFSEDNKEAMKGAQELMTVGATVTYTVGRREKEKEVAIRLASIPDTVMAKWIGRHMIEHSSVAIAKN